jgi:nucleotide-binding universal stress UspA family protein
MHPRRQHRLTADHPAQAILVHASDAPEGSLIIMGRRGPGHLSEHLLGSVSHRVVEATLSPAVLVN